MSGFFLSSYVRDEDVGCSRRKSLRPSSRQSVPAHILDLPDQHGLFIFAQTT
jgi:hypothetical protein